MFKEFYVHDVQKNVCVDLRRVVKFCDSHKEKSRTDLYLDGNLGMVTNYITVDVSYEHMKEIMKCQGLMSFDEKDIEKLKDDFKEFKDDFKKFQEEIPETNFIPKPNHISGYNMGD